MFYLLLFSFVSKNLTNYGRRHLKLFTNCRVSWDTLYQGMTQFVLQKICDVGLQHIRVKSLYTLPPPSQQRWALSDFLNFVRSSWSRTTVLVRFFSIGQKQIDFVPSQNYRTFFIYFVRFLSERSFSKIVLSVKTIIFSKMRQIWLSWLCKMLN